MKKLAAFIICLTIALFFAACASQPPVTEPLETRHPDWSKETIASIEKGEIVIGMTKDQVREALRHREVLHLMIEDDVWTFGDEQTTALVGRVTERMHELTFDENGRLLNKRIYILVYPHSW